MTYKIAEQPTVKNDPAKLQRDHNTTRSMAAKWMEFAYNIEPWDKNLVRLGSFLLVCGRCIRIKNGRMIRPWLTLPVR
ncbi:hypothetical protein LIPSTDRAFT_108002 [Lipomyces starkeyi NRRL Y-11557]|uniref:Uncharacterized protein n=1 Tax=Lipomyces starkeyi NRRL Y-11557 TaxID=675824 RepID=A0A1E3PV84_LIPST|nr:hypothetical protein LIPSTDRAFT_108002 [Lipomyces starkeyi NRRL Y-11557]